MHLYINILEKAILLEFIFTLIDWNTFHNTILIYINRLNKNYKKANIKYQIKKYRNYKVIDQNLSLCIYANFLIYNIWQQNTNFCQIYENKQIIIINIEYTYEILLL